MEYAFFGDAPNAESLDRFAELLGAELERRRLRTRGRRRPRREPRAQPASTPTTRSRSGARGTRHVRSRRLRARGAPRADRGVAPRRLPDARCARSRTSSSTTCPARARGSRPWSAATTASRRTNEQSWPRMVVERLRPARELAARDRQRVPHRPRAGALGRRRDHGVDPRGGRAARRARPAAEPVPDRGPADRARASPRQAPVRHRRAVVRQPLRAARTTTASG